MELCPYDQALHLSYFSLDPHNNPVISWPDIITSFHKRGSEKARKSTHDTKEGTKADAEPATCWMVKTTTLLLLFAVYLVDLILETLSRPPCTPLQASLVSQGGLE